MAEMRRMRPWLGTFVEIRAAADDGKAVAGAVEEAFAAVARVHGLMSFHDAGSDIGRLNRQAWREATAVAPWTWEVLAAALRLSRLSHGLFDVTVADRLVAGGLLPGTPVAAGGSWRDIELLADGRVRFHRPLLVDLGGIAKGFAVDRAVEALRGGGASRGIVNAGGDLRVFGDADQAIHVRDPASPHQVAGMLSLRDEALATSAPYFSTRRRGRRRVSPLVDPRSGHSCTRPISVSVRAPDCLTADALTKVVLADAAIARDVLPAYGARALMLQASGPRTSPEARRACPIRDDAPLGMSGPP